MTHIGEGISGAIFSEDRGFRYCLWRVWDRKQPALVFVGFNPSKADEVRDDPTVIKLAHTARDRDYGSIYIGNLFAIVSTNPVQAVVNPALSIGNENDHHLRELTRLAGIIVVGWGNNARYNDRYKEVLDILGSPVYCLAVTKCGQPSHPLYLPSWNELKEYLPSATFENLL